MYEFKYHRPATVRQAGNLLLKNEDAKLIAGGHTLVPVMKQRLASPPHLVDLSHIEGLDGIEMKGRSLVIGATAQTRDRCDVADRRRSHSGAGRTRRPDRRPRGAP
jgi:carbon-monoxide dehydrogenase medium subunit